MEDALVTQYGVVGIALLMVSQQIREFIARRNGRSVPPCVKVMETRLSRTEERVQNIERKTDDMHHWHCPNSDGEQTWKNATLAAHIKEMRDLMEKQTQTAARMLPVLERLEEKL
jgi:hypothetical protein